MFKLENMNAVKNTLAQIEACMKMKRALSTGYDALSATLRDRQDGFTYVPRARETKQALAYSLINTLDAEIELCVKDLKDLGVDASEILKAADGEG